MRGNFNRQQNSIFLSVLFLSQMLFFLLSAPVCNAVDKTEILVEKQGISDTLSITLREAILTALENNPTVTIQRLQPQIAETYVLEHRGDYDPNLSATTTRDETKMQRFLGSRPEPFELTSERSQYELSLSQKLPTGTVISAGAAMFGSYSSIYTDQFSGNVDITVTQALLQGFGIGVNLANLRKANLDLEISNEELKAVAEQIIADMESAYWNLYLAGEEVKINSQSLELAKQQLQESEERVRVGKLARLELAAVHAELAARQEALIDAQSRYEQARLLFIFLLNPNIPDPWRNHPRLEDAPIIPTDSLDDIGYHVQAGLKFRPDLRQARLNIKKGAIDVTLTRNGLLPRLDLFITLGRTTYAQSFREAVPDVKSPFYSVSGGLSFSFPVLDSKARAQYARAQLSQQQKQLLVKNMERLVERDVRSAFTEVKRSRQQIVATRVTRQLQNEKWLAELEKFRVGKSTNYLVLQAQRDLTASQIDEASAIVRHLNALINLYLMDGTLLDRCGINAL
ncbi:MAG TPA: TolC family protein [bacterium]|nr:TolC family protein [bacterium]